MIGVGLWAMAHDIKEGKQDRKGCQPMGSMTTTMVVELAAGAISGLLPVLCGQGSSGTVESNSMSTLKPVEQAL